MAGLSLSEAAKLANRGKSTIHRAIKRGALSASRQSDGTYRIDPAELARVFELKIHTVPTETSRQDDPVQPQEHPAALKVRVEMLEAALAREREAVEDLRGRLDRAEDHAKALYYHRRPGLWERIFGGMGPS